MFKVVELGLSGSEAKADIASLEENPSVRLKNVLTATNHIEWWR